MKHSVSTLTAYFTKNRTSIEFIAGFVVGSLIFGSCAFAYRASKPTQITLPLDDNKVAEINNALENLWLITNGRYEEFNERIIFTPKSTQSITAAGGLTPKNILNRVQGSGGAVDITANPQIADGTDGQILIIQGDSDTNTVKLDDGTGLALTGGVSFTMGKGDIVQLIFDLGDDIWYECYRADN